MKVLIYDNNYDDVEYLFGLLKSMPFDMDIERYTEYTLLEKNFNLNDHDIIFIDLESHNSAKLLKYIKEQTPEQRVVVFNNSLGCTEELGCESCKKNYNNCRIIKPVNSHDIIYVLKNDHCEFNYCEDDMFTKLTILSKPFHTLKVDIDSLRVYHSNSNNNLVISDTIDFTKLLDKNEIKFEVFEDYIQIYE